MSLAALMRLSEEFKKQQSEKFGGRVPIARQIVGYSKGHWLVEYTFRIQGGHSVESHWEQDERSLAHQRAFPNE